MVVALTASVVSAGNYEVCSPNGKVKVVVNTDQGVRWSVSYGEMPVLMPSSIDICLKQDKKVMSLGLVSKVTKHIVNQSFSTPFYKKAKVEDAYGQLLMYTNQKWTIEVRVYDDGAAYRLISTSKKPLLVEAETAEFRFADDYQAFVPYVNDNRGGERYCYSFESYYDEQPLSAMFSDSLAITPLAVCLPGGMKAMMEYLSSNVKYPVEAQKMGEQGRVIVGFIVEKDGTVSNAKVVKSNRYTLVEIEKDGAVVKKLETSEGSVIHELEAEALRVVQSMPKWTPGKLNGKAVRVKYNLPVSFRLQ